MRRTLTDRTDDDKAPDRVALLKRRLPMFPRGCVLMVILMIASASRAAGADSSVVREELKAAVIKALPPLTKGALGHREDRTCFACHNQGLPILAMTTARDRGLDIDGDELREQLQFIADFLGKNKDSYLEGKGQGGQADTAGYALVALELGGWKPDETTAAVAQYLLIRNADLDHWRANSQRPPSEGSHFTTTYVALRGLAKYHTAEQKERFEKRREQVRQWLVKTPARDHEDRVFRLLGLKLAGAGKDEIAAAAQSLIDRQRDDGGWAQLDAGEPGSATESDAYATGTSLVALHQAGELATNDEVYQRGLRYLLKTQRDDGTWHVVSRSKPIQKYFETGFPHGKDQFISSAATGWAATAMALAVEPADGDRLSRLPANKWTLLHEEDAGGGKNFARAIFAQNVQRLYLWGTGGQMPARNVYKRYELESFEPAGAKWTEAFPKAAAGKWTADDHPPFRILGQNGPDGLKHDEGPRLQVVSGYHMTNMVRFWDFDGIPRPSPIHTFNMACWDSKRNRIIYYSDSTTFALDPATNSWTDMKAANHPTACQVVAWAMMCYDSTRDRVILFGGGLATNPSGAAPTWLYDCATNKWIRQKRDAEPPPRCNGALVYDPATQSAVLFGGYNQSAALNDTWVFNGRTDSWSQRKPILAPPPMYEPVAALLPGVESKVLVCGYDARKVRLGHQAATSAQKETWIYHIAANTWTPIDASLNLPGYTWMTADASHKHGVVFMTAFGSKRHTYALRYDASAAPVELPGAKPGTVVWKYPEQKLSLEEAPAPDPVATAKMIENLPVNTMVDAAPPGMLISKTWSTAVLDSDRHEVLYLGGGHSGYSGNDIARYSLGTNRWSQDFPPRFPPYLEGTNAGLFGWSYGRMPFSQHTYLWYCHDPQSKTMVYFARPSIHKGIEVQPTDDPDSTFVYDPAEHGYTTWVYDPRKKQVLPPDFGRRFANEWHLCAIGTPRGVHVAENNRLHHAKVDRTTGRITWALVDDKFPAVDEKLKYHYEFQPIVHDTKRDRLVQLKGDGKRVHVFARGFGVDAKWELLAADDAAIGREAVYIPKHDVVLWLGDRLHVFDCASRTMRRLDVEMPTGRYNHECAMVYDDKYDVCIALIPRSFTGPMQTFLFRYRKE